MFLSDPAVNINPDVGRKVDMIRNAIWVAQRLGFTRPKVAVLAAIEKINIKEMPATADAAILAKMGEAGQFADADIAGPYALDIAVSRKAAECKHITGPVAGCADILLCPDINSANILYKSLIYFAGRELANAMIGVKTPLVMSSRSDSALTKLYTMALSVVLAGSEDMKKATERDLTVVVNPGSTSTKLAVYRGEECLACETIDHKKEELARFACVADQFEFRRDAVMRFLADHGVEGERCALVAGRGGILKPIPGGVYRVNARMLRELRASKWGEHPCNLGAPLAQEIAKATGAEAFIVDPPVVDEMWPLARYSGHPAFVRKSRFHALSQRAAARRAARELKIPYEKVNLIVVHMGGGITVGAHRRGRVVDVNDGLDGEGPMSPERSGSLPTGMLASLCFSGKVSHDEVKKMLVGHGGLYAYMGTNDCREIEERIRARRRQSPRTLRGDGV